MAAHADDFSLIHYGNAVGILYRGKAVGDDNGGAISHQAFQCELHHFFTFGIQRAGGFVQ